MDTEFLAQKLQQCSRTDKQECLAFVRPLLEIAFLAREQDYVKLDRFVRESRDTLYRDPFFTKAISCLVDLRDSDLIRRVLENYMFSGNYIGQQFFKNLLITETIIAVHRRVDVDHIFSFLVPSLFGLEFEGSINEMHRAYVQGHGFRLSAEAPADEPNAPNMG